MFFQVRHSDQDSTLNETPYERVAASLARLDKLPAVHAADVAAEKWPSLFKDIVRGEPVAHELSIARFGTSTSDRGDSDDFSVGFGGSEAGLVEFEFEYRIGQEASGRICHRLL